MPCHGMTPEKKTLFFFCACHVYFFELDRLCFPLYQISQFFEVSVSFLSRIQNVQSFQKSKSLRPVFWHGGACPKRHALVGKQYSGLYTRRKVCQYRVIIEC